MKIRTLLLTAIKIVCRQCHKTPKNNTRYLPTPFRTIVRLCSLNMEEVPQLDTPQQQSRQYEASPKNTTRSLPRSFRRIVRLYPRQMPLRVDPSPHNFNWLTHPPTTIKVQVVWVSKFPNHKTSKIATKTIGPTRRVLQGSLLWGINRI